MIVIVAYIEQNDVDTHVMTINRTTIIIKGVAMGSTPLWLVEIEQHLASLLE